MSSKRILNEVTITLGILLSNLSSQQNGCWSWSSKPSFHHHRTISTTSTIIAVPPNKDISLTCNNSNYHHPYTYHHHTRRRRRKTIAFNSIDNTDVGPSSLDHDDDDDNNKSKSKRKSKKKSSKKPKKKSPSSSKSSKTSTSSSKSSSSISSSSSSSTIATTLKQTPKPSSMETSLCIIPPDDAWDDIQRARHMVHDPTFYNWPPAIRLFHPFIPKDQIKDCALDIANVIEMYELEPFNVTLDHLLILPHLEVIEEMEEERKMLPKNSDDDDHDDYEESDGNTNRIGKNRNTSNPKLKRKMTKEERDINALIESEERKGRQKLEKRLARERERKKLKQNNDGSTSDSSLSESSPPSNKNHYHNSIASSSSSSSSSSSKKDKSPREILAEQQQSKSQFNGPCILCLEPDEDSQIQLQTLREILRKKLFGDYDPFSPSSTLPRSQKNQQFDNKGILIHSNSNNGSSGGRSSNGGGSGELDGGYLLPKSILEKHGLIHPSKAADQGSLISNSSSGTSNSRRKLKKQKGCTYRPLIVLGQFSAVTAAVETARKLQQLWEPLTFEVGDLQLISTRNNHQNSQGMTAATTHDHDSSNHMDHNNQDDLEPIIPENREYEIRKKHGTLGSATSSLFVSTGSSTGASGENDNEYGCDAMIMLMGEEYQLLQTPPSNEGNNEVNDQDTTTSTSDDQNMKSNDIDEEKMIELLMTNAGTPGGANNQNNPNSSATKSQPYLTSNAGESFYIGNDDQYANDIEDKADTVMPSAFIEDWLNEDEDEYDEGATVVIGRTQFFMGEMRQYTGMPASSTIDGKDKKLGNEAISGSARRRGAVHRQGDRWNDGDFGRKEKDMLA